MAALLQSEEGGLGLDLARDAATLEAIQQALPRLADTQIRDLRGRRLEASDFLNLLTPDPARSLLEWLDDPQAMRRRWPENEWEGFRFALQVALGHSRPATTARYYEGAEVAPVVPMAFVNLKGQRADAEKGADRGQKWGTENGNAPEDGALSALFSVVGDTGIEPVTSAMSRQRSNQN